MSDILAGIKVDITPQCTTYMMNGNWDELNIAKMLSVVERVDSPYLIQYKNWKYQAPQYEYQGVFRKKKIVWRTVADDAIINV